MILGTGIDIAQIDRIEAALSRTKGLAERILTPVELEGFQRDSNPHRYLAKRFAAKEAAVKALGTGIGQGVGWHHFEIVKDAYGKPGLEVSQGAKRLADEKGIKFWHLSYTDEKQYVVAMVIAEG
ncbi:MULTISPECIES: holo-ACP synthase [Nitrincola]|uniref:Holo-[acyl-carrier-protein] synthase n=1 Tax=Nitrincola nitratireducens TaxID=1229521 RepID=W9VM25_9GAMM|nr:MULTISPECIES: holo-ACP synthase [Nitrincola]EXJ11575.1 Holo-[acyl-carrier-protein] synthase [Nitrincola nitratireducens]